MSASKTPISPTNLSGYMVTNEFYLPLRHHESFIEGNVWARENEHYLGQFQLLEATHPRIKYSWRG